MYCFRLLDQGTSDGEDASCWKEYAAAVVVGGTAAVAAAPFVLSAAGFTAAGVTAGSVAAGIQSVVYGGAVTSTSLFAALQSAGAAGVGLAAKVGIFSAGGGALAYIKNKLAPCEEGPNCSSDTEE